MTKLKMITAAAALTVGGLGFAPAAFAWDGCGWGYHQNSWGQCRPNYRPAYGYGYGGGYAYRPVYGYGYGYRPAYRPAYYGYGYRPYRPGFSVSFRPF